MEEEEEVRIEAREEEEGGQELRDMGGREATQVAAAEVVQDQAEVGAPEDVEDILHHIPADLLQGNNTLHNGKVN